MKHIFTNLEAAPFTDSCESCGWDMAFTGVMSNEGEGRFGTCHHCGVTENTWVDAEDLPEPVTNVIYLPNVFPPARADERAEFDAIIAGMGL